MLSLNVQVIDYANTTEITTCFRIAMSQTSTEKKIYTMKQNTQYLNTDTSYQCFEVFH